MCANFSKTFFKRKLISSARAFFVRGFDFQVPNMPNICIRPQDSVLRIASHQPPYTEFHSTDPNGHFVVRTKVVLGHEVQVFGQPNNQILIVGDDNIEFSFLVGRASWIMACVTYTELPAHEQNIFGRDELVVNNNWRITTGPEEYATNRYFNSLLICEGRKPLFSVYLDEEINLPRLVDIRLGSGKIVIFDNKFCCHAKCQLPELYTEF